MNFNANTQITENTSDYKHITRNEYRNNSANACEALVWSIPQQCRQVAQLSPRDRAAGCVSFGRNIVPVHWLLRSLLGTELDELVIAQVPAINALVLSNLSKSYTQNHIT